MIPSHATGAVGRESSSSWTLGPVTTLEFRNPALCEVCSYWFHMPGDVIDAIYDAGLVEYHTVMEPFASAKVAGEVERGRRRPQSPSDRPLIQTRFSFVRLPRPDS